MKIGHSSFILPDVAILRICRLWRDIALNSSGLCREIVIDFKGKTATEVEFRKFLLVLRKRLALAKRQFISFEICRSYLDGPSHQCADFLNGLPALLLSIIYN